MVVFVKFLKEVSVLHVVDYAEVEYLVALYVLQNHIWRYAVVKGQVVTVQLT